jgi:hypothetical protein
MGSSLSPFRGTVTLKVKIAAVTPNHQYSYIIFFEVLV